MTDAEKDARTALDNCIEACENHFQWSFTIEQLRTLKAMLAEPRMPTEPDQATVDAMTRGWYRGSGLGSGTVALACAPYGTLGEAFRRAWADAYAHLTKPATKTVEVWDCRWTHAGELKATPHHSREDAETDAKNLREHPHNKDGQRWKCIHVTGPHEQEVPT